MDTKPNIFIGSSREGLEVAEMVKKHLSHFADCKIWNENVFKYNKSYFDTIMELLAFFDYGIMVGTADDLVVSRNIKNQETRDNVLFEFGLFLGRLGREKVFFMKEKDAKTPSDLAGIALPEFSRKEGDLEAQIRERCDNIIEQITSEANIFYGGIYPSIPLAYGYFYNSLLPVCQHLLNHKDVIWQKEKMQIKNYQFRVLLPDDLRSDMKEKVQVVKMKDQWNQIEIPSTGARSYIFYVQEAKVNFDKLELLDIPTTLNSLYQTIKEFLGDGKVGQSIKEKLVEGREIRHFQKVLDYLIESNAATKNFITTEIVDI